MTKTVLVLDRAGEKKEYSINFKSMKDLLVAVPKLQRFISQGWELIDVQGKGKMADFFRKQIEDSKKGKYVVPFETVKMGLSESPYKEKISFRRVKRFLRRKKK